MANDRSSAPYPGSARRKRIALAVGGLLHFFHDGIADGLAVFLPLWQAAFGLSLTQVGLLVSCFEGATGFFQIPAGLLGERWGERGLLTAGTLMTAVSFTAIGLTGGLAGLLVLLIVGGLGASVQHPLASTIVSKAYEERGRRMGLGTYNFTGDVGKFVFPALAAVLLVGVGWRPVCIGFGLFGCLLAVAVHVLLYRAGIAGSRGCRDNPRSPNEISGWRISDKGAFSVLCAIGVVDTAVRVGFVVFLPFLLIQKGLAPESAGFALSLLFVGGAAGKFLCGAVAERAGVTATVVLTEAVTGGGILLMAAMPLAAVYIALPFLGAALNGTSSVLYGTVADFVDPSRMARAFGVFYTFVIAASAVAPPIAGMLGDAMTVSGAVIAIGLFALTTLPLVAVLHGQMAAKKA